MRRPTYLSDMTNAQWERPAPLLPPAKLGGRPRVVDIRAVVDAIFVWRCTITDGKIATAMILFTKRETA